MPHVDGAAAGVTPGAAPPALRITVLAGGPSAEREISLVSGAAVADALRSRGHSVQLADIGPADLSALDAHSDVIFPALHGTFGEDGQLQKLLEDRGRAFVGSGSAASATAMDKWATKQAALGIGLKTAPAELRTAGDPRPDEVPPFGVPLVVKPVDQGSSVATYIVREVADFAPAVTDVVRRFERALVEQFVAGREITVGIIDRTPLPPIWIRPKRAFYDFDAKYRVDDTEYEFQTGLSPTAAAALEADSLRLFDALGCRHLGRIDWIVDDAGAAWLLEVNTLPGFTSHSLVPKAAAKIGISFPELVERLVRMPLENA